MELKKVRRAVFSLRENSSRSPYAPVGRGKERYKISKRCGMEAVKVKKKKGGRPKKSVIRERTTGIRFSKTEHFIIQEKAKKAGLRLTTYIRQTAIESKVKTRMTEEEKIFIRQLIGLSNNINQIARVCHTEGVLRAMAYFEQIRIKIDQLLKNLKL